MTIRLLALAAAGAISIGSALSAFASDRIQLAQNQPAAGEAAGRTSQSETKASGSATKSSQSTKSSKDVNVRATVGERSGGTTVRARSGGPDVVVKKRSKTRHVITTGRAPSSDVTVIKNKRYAKGKKRVRYVANAPSSRAVIVKKKKRVWATAPSSRTVVIKKKRPAVGVSVRTETRDRVNVRSRTTESGNVNVRSRTTTGSGDAGARGSSSRSSKQGGSGNSESGGSGTSSGTNR